MPNQLNFPDRLPVKIVNERPSRLAKTDTKLFEINKKQTVFGITEKDVVELWIYYPDGRIAGHVLLSPTDESLNLITGIDNTGAYEFLNIEMGEIVRRMQLEQGRYGLVANIFRNEIGSAQGEKLFIQTISEDRTELRLTVNRPSNELLHDIYEFIVPSVPKLIAQGLISQTFNETVDFVNPSDKLDSEKVIKDLDLITSNTSSRINYSDSRGSYDSIMKIVFERVHNLTLDYMDADKNNFNIQEIDLEKYISQATQEVIRQMVDRGEIDNRFEIV